MQQVIENVEASKTQLSSKHKVMLGVFRYRFGCLDFFLVCFTPRSNLEKNSILQRMYDLRSMLTFRNLKTHLFVA